jgi:hypothetical protein
MNEREANIDLVFRNGLKDLEVLPPQDVWENIQPVISQKRKSLIFMRAAAMIAVILTMSFLAYRWSREISTSVDNAVVTFNDEAAFPVNTSDITSPPSVPGKEYKAVKNSQKTFIESSPEIDIVSDAETRVLSSVAFLQKTNTLSTENSSPLEGLRLVSSNSFKNGNTSPEVLNAEYLPENTSLKETDRWSIAAMASPTYYSRVNLGNDEISKQLMASEQPLMSYSGGVTFSYKVNKRFSIQSGLFYSSVGQEVDGINSFGGFQQYVYTKGDHNFEVLTTNGTVYTNNADVFLSADGPGERISTNYTNDVFDPKKASLQYINNTLKQDLSYLELPVFLRYKLVDKTIDLNLIGGIAYNMLVNNSVFTTIDGEKYPIGKTEGLNPVSFSSSLGMGMEYNFSKNISFNLEPTLRYYLNPSNQITGSKIHPYTFGIFSGISYRF